MRLQTLTVGLIFMSAIIYSGTPTINQNLVPTASLNTLEKLLLWCLLLFDYLNARKDVPLIAGDSVQRSSYQRFLGKDGNLYLGFTVFVAVTSEYDSAPTRGWVEAVEMNTAVGSTNFNS